MSKRSGDSARFSLSTRYFLFFLAVAALCFLQSCGGGGSSSGGGSSASPQEFLYVTNGPTGTLSAFSIGSGDTLTALPISPISTVALPEQIAADSQGQHLFVADSATSQVYAYSINQSSGALTEVGTPQAICSGAPVGMAVQNSLGWLLVNCNTSQNIYGFSIAANGSLSPLPASPVVGPTIHPIAIRLDPSGEFAFVADNQNSNVDVYQVNGTSFLVPVVQSSSGPGPAGTITDSTGNFLYVLTAGDEKVHAFSIASGGTLSALSPPSYSSPTQPLVPALSPQGRLYINSTSLTAATTLSGFTIDSSTGALTAIPGTPPTFAEGLLPYGLVFDPSGQFVYVAVIHDNSVWQFSVNSTTGALTQLGTPVPAGEDPEWLAVVTTHP